MASPSTLASCARVFKRWKEPALDMLWMDISDLHVLFQLLAPMELDDGTWKFSSAETPLQWDRFDYYAEKLHRFEYKNAEDDGDDEDEDAPPLGISEDTWTTIARVRRHLPLLPKLTFLQWQSIHTTDILLFLSPSLMELKLIIRQFPPQITGHHSFCFGQLLQQCATKSPGLKKFILQTQLNILMVQNELSSFLQSLPGLEMIMLPYFTPRSHQLLTAISHLPNLRRLETLVWSSVIKEIPPIDNTLFDGTFPALTEVDLHTQLDDIQHVLQNPNFPCTLKTLVIRSVPPITSFLLWNMISQVSKLNILKDCSSTSARLHLQLRKCRTTMFLYCSKPYHQ
ncbi:hypothetical protein M422DRAFT_259280 [Sphaerobolus stellatus SS14]|uniref:F-box domain-containing protein n=1 Tax=Sphaerobolus stellatus (strain SS14) TaxID=990650 RepID=A0A0C9VK79_SPHS4|nr:hypothetical protein M422DRAFT_259280 [Sphaerobolus stellatus SS14]